MDFTTSPNCSRSVGCKFHRSWDSTFVRNTFYQGTGFTTVDISCCNKMSKSLISNKNAEQRLCYLANHKAINHVMKTKKYPAKKLIELTPEHEQDTKEKSACLGLNYNMGTDKIAIRLRQNDGISFLPHSTVVETMIHELTHMDVSDHGPDFVAKEKELTKIYQEALPREFRQSQSTTTSTIYCDVSGYFGKNLVYICLLMCLLLAILRRSNQQPYYEL